MDIPQILIQQIQDGKAVLFLGAGASFSSKNASGQSPPSGRKLGEMLAGRFLGGKFPDAPLAQIAELAISETDLVTVQEAIRALFEGFEPSEAHKHLGDFKWAGLVTTNYERLIEEGYAANAKALQSPKVFIENGDRVEDSMRDPTAVMLLKIHGCFTRLSNPACPLILTPEQYITHRNGRSRIFDHLKSWAYERTIVFVGHSLQDSDIRAMLLELVSLGETRPRYYVVAPNMSEIEVRLWESKRITPLKGTFEEFIRSANSAVPSNFRGVSAGPQKVKHPISSHFTANDVELSRNCIQFLESDVDYVASAGVTGTLNPIHFYRGHNQDWAGIEQDLDVRRTLGDTIIADNFLVEEADHAPQMEFLLIKSHAGGGKSIMLRRIAWDAAHDYDCLCLYLKSSGAINVSAIQEIASVCGERIYLFVDDAGDRVREIQSLAKNIQEHGKKLTLIGAERTNEWNVSCSSIAQLVTTEYELRYLSEVEIGKLLTLLGKHKALGTLEGKTLEEQKKSFLEVAGRQLLVALHEATLGKPFEDIIEDEFNQIVPADAQRIYLTICVLNRLGIGVRAGIVSRIHGIHFKDFQERLFKPLEQVVFTTFDGVIRDYVYESRHPFIAEIVFERILKRQEERFDNYLKCLKTLNVDYSTDRRAFRLMIRGRLLLELFPNPELVKQIYEAAKILVGEDSYLLHQMGLYEMHVGNLKRAGELLLQAEHLASYDSSIKHSRAELLLKMAEHARTPLERETYLREAAKMAESIKGAKVNESHVYHTLVKVELQRLESLLAAPGNPVLKEDIGVVINRVERALTNGLQQFPGDSYLLTAESRLATLLKDSDRVVESLSKAFTINPRTSFIAIQLAGIYEKQGKLKEAKEVYERALDANRNDKDLHYRFAKHLLNFASASADLIEYHLQRAFAPGDRNYDAQLLFGRQLYVKGDRDLSKTTFAELKKVRVSPQQRESLLYPLDGIYRGSLVRIEGNYAYINKDRSNEWVYVHRRDIPDDVWKLLVIGTRLLYKVAFNFHGPAAFDLKLED